MKLLGSFLRLAVILSLTPCSRFHSLDNKESSLFKTEPKILAGSYFEVIKNPASKTMADLLEYRSVTDCSTPKVGDTLNYDLQVIAKNSIEMRTSKNDILCRKDKLFGCFEEQYLYLQQQKKWDFSEGYLLFSTKTRQNRVGIKTNGDMQISSWNRWGT